MVICREKQDCKCITCCPGSDFCFHISVAAPQQLKLAALQQQLQVTELKQQVQLTESQQQLEVVTESQQLAIESEVQQELPADNQHVGGDISMEDGVKGVAIDSTLTVNKDFLDPISRQILEQVSQGAQYL